MKLVIDIPEDAYKLLNNEGVDWLGAEHILNAVANGTPLPKGHSFIAICNSDYPITEEVRQELKNTVFVGDECNYCFDMTEIIEVESEK